jgi:hypothetical protein
MNMDELKKLYPSLSDEELSIVQENLDLYLKLAWEICTEGSQAEIDGHFL